MPDTSNDPSANTPVAAIAGSSPTNPHTHVKIIDETHELFGRVCKILESTAEHIVVELESAGSWIKSKRTHKQVAMAPAPVVSPAPETTATTEPPVSSVPPAETAPAGDMPAS